MITVVCKIMRPDTQIEVHSIGDSTGVGQTQTHRFFKRHDQTARHPSIFTDGKEQIFVGIHARRRTEKIAQRRLDAFLSIKLNFEQQKSIGVVGSFRIVPIQISPRV